MCVLFTGRYLPRQPATATGEHYGDVRCADFHGPDRREGDHPSIIGRTIVRRFRITTILLYNFRLPIYNYIIFTTQNTTHGDTILYAICKLYCCTTPTRQSGSL